jgi:hypothetical protein
MILEIADALGDVIHQATPDVGARVVLHSLSQGDTALPDKKGILALIAVEEHDCMDNRPVVEGNTGPVRSRKVPLERGFASKG